MYYVNLSIILTFSLQIPLSSKKKKLYFALIIKYDPLKNPIPIIEKSIIEELIQRLAQN